MSMLEKWGQFIWHKEEKKFLGRSKRGWGEICAFFIVFYIILLSYFCAMISFFYQTVSEDKPNHIGDGSFLLDPGLGIRPLLKTEDGNAYTSLIYFKANGSDRYTKNCIKNLKDFLKPYKKADDDGYTKYWKDCNNGTTKPDQIKSCVIYYKHLTRHGCNETNGFGYPGGKPCVLLRLNKIYDWNPDPYTAADSKMPKDLQETVKRYYKQTSKKDAAHFVWVHCEGEDELDKDNLGNKTEYYPDQGFRVNYFPYLNQYRHLAPLVFVRFLSLTPNIAVKVHCKVYAKNIKINTEAWSGGFHVELLFRQP